jgi:hypothetical protein
MRWKRVPYSDDVAMRSSDKMQVVKRKATADTRPT